MGFTSHKFRIYLGGMGVAKPVSTDTDLFTTIHERFFSIKNVKTTPMQNESSKVLYTNCLGHDNMINENKELTNSEA